MLEPEPELLDSSSDPSELLLLLLALSRVGLSSLAAIPAPGGIASAVPEGGRGEDGVKVRW